MKVSDLKELMIRSLDKDNDPSASAREIENSGAVFSFGEGFTERVLDTVFSKSSAVVRKTEFVRDLNNVFYRIALSGVAAIILLLISIFIMEGSFSLNSFLGLGDRYDETILCLLTGN
jgi:hypothetical protein